ncbi:MAG TPA: hypothetical protein VK788_24215, partial [Terriglobales bacterium]|nr:hypothetical protein [Terriglobales bacterium]
RTVVLPHHKQPASEIGDCLQHHFLSSAYNLAVIALASTNSVTFSTPTGFFANCHSTMLTRGGWLCRPIPSTRLGREQLR